MRKNPAGVKAQDSAGKPRRWVRRRILVDPSFQFRMLMPIGIFLVVFALLAGAFVFLPLYRNAAYDPDPVARALLGEQLLSLHVRLWPMLGIAALLSSIYTLIRSIRVAGPLFKLMRGLLQMMAGEYQNIRFRRGDELRDFEDVSNKLAATIDSISASNLRKTAAVEQRLKFLKSRLEVRDLPKNEILDELDELIEQITQVRVIGSGSDQSQEVQ